VKLEAIHREYSYEDLLSWRKLANASVEVDKNVPIEKKVANFFNSWFAPKEPVKEKDTEAVLKELYKVIGYQAEGILAAKKTEGIIAEMPKDYVHTVISVHLNSFAFKLVIFNSCT
jgi:hypothetical protein